VVPPAAQSSHLALESRDDVWFEAVPSIRPLFAHGRPGTSSEKREVVLDRGPADPEFENDDLLECARGVLATRENLDDAPSYRLGQHFERVHPNTVSVRADVSAN
jgi:hypothetical protein